MMLKRSFTLLLLLIITAAQVVVAQQTEYQFGLKEALNYGLEHSVEIRQAVLDREQAEHKVGEVRSSGLPQVSAEGQYQQFINLPTQLIPGDFFGTPGEDAEVQFGTEYNMTGTFNANQLLFSQEFFTGLKAATASRELYSYMKIQTEEDVIYQIASAYYQALQIQSQIGVLESNLGSLSKVEKTMKAQYEHDMVTKTNLNRIKVNQSNLTAQLQTLKTNYNQQINYLKLLMGMDISTPLTILENEGMESVSLQLLQSDSFTPISLDILKQQEKLYALNVKATQGGYYPTLSLFAQHTWQAQRDNFNFTNSDYPWFKQTVWGLTLQVPIFDGLKKHHVVQQQKIDLEKLTLQKRNTEQQLDMQYDNARRQLVNSLASVESQRENRTLAKDVYEQTQSLYKEEVATLSELLDAEQAYRQAESTYYTEIIKFRTSELELLKSQGQIKTILN